MPKLVGVKKPPSFDSFVTPAVQGFREESYGSKNCFRNSCNLVLRFRCVLVFWVARILQIARYFFFIFSLGFAYSGF